VGSGDEDTYRYPSWTRHVSGPPTEQADHSQTRELCGVLVADGSRLYGLVMDSSLIHASDPAMDGSRRGDVAASRISTARTCRYAISCGPRTGWARS
jgi:hypothetical protein